MAGLSGFPMGSAYCATKWAVLGFTEPLKSEVRDSKIKVAAVLPGSVDTPFFDNAGMIPNKERCLTPEDVAVQIFAIAQQGEHSDIDRVVIRPGYTP